MRRDWTPAATRVSGRTRRVAWLIGFVIPMVLLALMFTLRPAAAATLPVAPTGQPPAVPAVIELTEPEEEVEEGGEAGSECAEEETEAEEEAELEEVEGPEAEEEAESEAEEESEGCGGKHRNSPPPQCLLRSARARLFAYSNRDLVRLVIRYTTFAPATVAVEYSLNGSRGAAKLGSQTRRFSGSGLYRQTEKLSRRGEMGKVLTARGFTVTMDIAAAPKYCHRYYTRHLTVRRAVHGQTVWYQAGSTFGTRRK